MILGIDASSANKQKKTGVEWYAYNLIQAMKAHPLAVEDRVRLYSPSALVGDLSTLPAQWESQVLNWSLKSGWMQGRVSWEMMRRPPNVLFVPSQSLPKFAPHNASKKRVSVTMIHDVGFRRRPDLYDPADRKRQEQATTFAVKRARLIFTPSEFTKAELVELFHAKPEQVMVTPLGVDPAFRVMQPTEVEPVCAKYRLGRKNYFFAVGRLDQKKNLGVIIRAFEMFKQAQGFGDPMQLVLAGPPGFGVATVKQYIELSPAKAFIRVIDWVDQADLPGLMSGAFAYLFPSWYEGFGIPSLEAMASGTTLIVSDIPSHREVTGGAALLVHPGEPEAWSAAFKRMMTDSHSFEERTKLGIERAKTFTWGRTADLTWGAIKSLL